MTKSSKQQTTNADPLLEPSPFIPEADEKVDDPVLDRMAFVFLLVFFLCVLFIPQEWFVQASMWWNGIQ